MLIRTSKKMNWLSGLLTLLALAATATAQNRHLSATYGEGVHSFHRGDITAARSLFDEAIHGGSTDARAYYFRAFTNIRQGNWAAAESDIRQGAMYEVQGTGSASIGRALERVQGSDRIRFERIRRQAKMEYQRTRPANAPNTFTPPTVDRRYLRDNVDSGATNVPIELAPQVFDDSDPFTNEPSDTPPAPVEDDMDLDEDFPAEDSAEDMFADEPMEDTTPAEVEDDDPFGDDGGMDDLDSADAGDDDVFGGGDDADMGDDGGDPFGDDGDDPFAEDGDDPFGDDSGDGGGGGDIFESLFDE